jgi:hypothetical protein
MSQIKDAGNGSIAAQAVRTSLAAAIPQTGVQTDFFHFSLRCYTQCHSSASWNPGPSPGMNDWIPAFPAGITAWRRNDST